MEWISHAREVEPDPVSGARITQITGGGVLYCESPKASPDGKRFVLQRGDAYYACDLETMAFAQIAEDCKLVNAPYGEHVYCWHAEPEQDVVDRVDLRTLQREHVTTVKGLPRSGNPQSVASAEDYLVYHVRRPPTCEVYRVDLPSGEWALIHDDPEIINGHVQVEPGRSEDILFQQNRGGRMDADGNISKQVGTEGTTHYVVARDGSRRRSLPVGPPHTSTGSGHSAWIGATGRVLLAVAWNMNEAGAPGAPLDWTLDERYPESNLFIVAPGDTEPTPFVAPDQRFFHVSVSQCGGYFVCNSVPNGRLGPTEIVVGDLATGKYRTLIHDCACYAGSVWPCSLPYLTADLRYVVFREKEDPGLPGYQGFQVYVAEVSQSFLSSLEGEQP